MVESLIVPGNNCIDIYILAQVIPAHPRNHNSASDYKDHENKDA